MKSFDTWNMGDARACIVLELTRVPSLWNHSETVALYFVRREGFRGCATERRNLLGCDSVK